MVLLRMVIMMVGRGIIMAWISYKFCMSKVLPTWDALRFCFLIRKVGPDP